MAGSFGKIDYRLRPAKAIERRMMAEAFLRLRPFGSVESYRYVGMGSVYFSDFTLFHNVCGFESLVSIEDETNEVVQERFRFNVPLGHLELCFGHSNTVLPTLPWDLRSVVWLDYDGVFTKEVLTDIRYLASKLVPGSMLSVSVNAELRDEEEGKKPRLQVLTERLGSIGKIPALVTSAGAIKPGEVAKVYREIMTQEITDGINDRNAGRPAGQKFSFRQVFFFEYRDGAPMLTLGWVIFDDGQSHTYGACSFNGLLFFRPGDEPFSIVPPLLTNAEMREINRSDEVGTFSHLDDLPLPKSETDKFIKLRRYWPLGSFADLT